MNLFGNPEKKVLQDPDPKLLSGLMESCSIAGRTGGLTYPFQFCFNGVWYQADSAENCRPMEPDELDGASTSG